MKTFSLKLNATLLVALIFLAATAKVLIGKNYLSTIAFSIGMVLFLILLIRFFTFKSTRI
jgi:hypothetical protein